MKLLIAFACVVFAGMANATTCALVGDSISHGFGVTPQSRFAHLLQVENALSIKDLSSPGAALGLAPPFGFNSDAINGQLSTLLGFFNAIDCVIVQAGTNDYGGSASPGTPLESTMASLTRITAWARANGKKVLVLEPIWRAGETANNGQGRTLDHYRYGLYVVCVTQNSDVCIFAPKEGSSMGTSLAAAHYLPAEVSNNKQLHPNVTGHRKLADWIANRLTAAGYF